MSLYQCCWHCGEQNEMCLEEGEVDQCKHSLCHNMVSYGSESPKGCRTLHGQEQQHLHLPIELIRRSSLWKGELCCGSFPKATVPWQSRPFDPDQQARISITTDLLCQRESSIALASERAQSNLSDYYTVLVAGKQRKKQGSMLTEMKQHDVCGGQPS